MKKILLLRVALLLGLICSCSNNDSNTNDNAIPELSIYNKSISISSKDSIVSLSFYTNTLWNISVESSTKDETWWHISKEKGDAGENTIEVRISKNDSYDGRMLFINIYAKDEKGVIYLMQDAKSVIVLNQNKYNVQENGDTISINVESNVSYKLNIPTEYDWIKEIPNTGRELTQSVLKIEVSQNQTLRKREAKLYISNNENNIEEEISIYQGITPINKVINTPGSLLNNIGGVDSVLSIRKIKISGGINSDDIAVIRTLKNLWYLDINEASLFIGGGHYGNNPDDVLSYENGRVNGMSMFANMKNLKTVIWSKNIDIINNATFQNCESLDSIFIPENVKEIRTYAFEYCSDLKKITLPNSIIEIGHGAFCFSGIENIKFPDSLKKIGNLAFRGSGLTSINLPISLEEIGSECFSQCYNLRNAYINYGIKHILEKCFFMCGELEIISIPETIEGIWREAFSNCDNIKEIYMYGNKEKIKSYGDWIFTGDDVYENAVLYIKKGTSINDWYMTPFFNFKNVKAVL